MLDFFFRNRLICTDSLSRGVDLPTLMLLGSESPPHLRESTEAVAAVLLQATVVELPGQEHAALQKLGVTA